MHTLENFPQYIEYISPYIHTYTRSTCKRAGVGREREEKSSRKKRKKENRCDYCCVCVLVVVLFVFLLFFAWERERVWACGSVTHRIGTLDRFCTKCFLRLSAASVLIPIQLKAKRSFPLSSTIHHPRLLSPFDNSFVLFNFHLALATVWVGFNIALLHVAFSWVFLLIHFYVSFLLDQSCLEIYSFYTPYSPHNSKYFFAQTEKIKLRHDTNSKKGILNSNKQKKTP